VAEVAGEAARTPHRPPVDDQAGDDAGVAGDVGEVGGAGVRAVAVLGRGGEVGAAVDVHVVPGLAQRLEELTEQVDVAPGEDVRVPDGSVGVDHAGHADGEREDPAVERGEPGDDLGGERRDAAHRLGRGGVEAGERAPPGDQLGAGEVERDCGEVVGADLHADRRVAPAVDREHGGGPADAVLGDPGLPHQAAVDELGDDARHGRLVEAGARRDVGP
jgi:hypothetical protein